MFSPIAERSPRTRILYFVTYAFLILGGLTMIFPFLIMMTGSLEPYPQKGVNLFPSYLVSSQEMWKRFLQVKYSGDASRVRAAWGDDTFDFRDVRRPDSPLADGEVASWREFLEKTSPPAEDFLLAFVPSPRMPSYSFRLFQRWLLAEYEGDLARLNESLGTRFVSIAAIRPPAISVISFPPAPEGLLAKYSEFLNLHPDLRLPADVGGYYRNVFLPAQFDNSLEAFNKKYRTEFESWAQIPFTAEAPRAGSDEWLLFVGKVLRPDFIRLTPLGEAACQSSGLSRRDFIRTQASQTDMRVETLDLHFAEWSQEHKGVSDARIPQKTLDELQFFSEKNLWKVRFAALNYQHVLDEILLHGHAFTNTIILVVLFVVGALTINPLAAYALSRFKFRQTYAVLIFCLVTTAFPGEVLMIPVFLQLKEFHLLNTFGALVLPTLANGFSIFLLKGFFDSLPRELYEAAEIDGASNFVMFWHITMNLSKPILAVIALGAFNAAYGTFFYALILAPDPSMWTVMVYIFQLQMSAASPVVYASLLLVSIPTFLIFIFCQNLILRGIVVPTEK